MPTTETPAMHAALKFITRTLCALPMLALLAACAHDLHVERGRVFAEPGGERLKMNLYMPQETAEAQRPGIVMVHGGGWIAGTRTQQAWYARHFAREGYVVLSCDYRMMPRHAFPACVEDAKAAVRWMRAHADELHVDPNRIAAFGASAGGHIAGMLAATQPADGFEGAENPGPSSAVQAAVILYGAVDLTAYRDGAGGGTGSKFVGSFVGKNFPAEQAAARNIDAFEWASPITYVHAGMPPVHLTHGTHDMLVPHVQSERLYKRLQDTGVPAKLSLYQRRNHGFDYMFPEERREIFGDMRTWLEQNL